jgi:curli biogenesis system outer membrane secretion channel CsgG
LLILNPIVFSAYALHSFFCITGIVMKKRLIALRAVMAIITAGLAGCATESYQSVPIQKVASADKPYVGPRTPIAVGKFDNRSPFMRGLFADGVDRLGSQAKTILVTDLQQTQRFIVLDRDNMDESRQEASIKQQAQTLVGADYIVTGDVTEFGRKEVGDQQLFGILGRGKQQVAYAKVSLNVVDSRTSVVVFSAQGAGEYTLSNREIVGFGGTASYDSTLNGKVLDLAIREAVGHLTDAIDAGTWKPVK